MPRRIDLGRALLVLGAALLIASLFVSWFGDGLTAWQAFEVVDMVLAALALAAVALALRPDEGPAWAPVAVPAAVLAIVVVQIVNPPPAAAGASPDTGAWLALGAGVAMALAAALMAATLEVTVRVGGRARRERVAAVDRREPEVADDVAATVVEPAGADAQPTEPLRAVGDHDDDHDPSTAPDRP